MGIVSGDKSITALAAEKLIQAHDGDMALLYLYMLFTGSDDTEKAAGALCRTLREMDEAAEKLRRLDISVTPGAVIPEPAEELPEYTADDVMRRMGEDDSFRSVVGETQKVLGHVLSAPDMKKLFGMYDYLHLPAEVILMLINHCVALSTGRRPSMRYIEKEAYRWANLEIFTVEQADDYMRSSNLRRDKTASVSRILGIQGRSASTTEANYISSWLDMGFGEDAIELAYDRTVTNTGTLKWPYLNKILQSWHQKGLHTASEIAEKDGRSQRTAASTANREQPRVDLARLREGLDDIDK